MSSSKKRAKKYPKISSITNIRIEQNSGNKNLREVFMNLLFDDLQCIIAKQFFLRVLSHLDYISSFQMNNSFFCTNRMILFLRIMATSTPGKRKFNQIEENINNNFEESSFHTPKKLILGEDKTNLRMENLRELARETS